MLEAFLPNFAHETAGLHTIGTAGWVIGFNITYLTGAEHVLNNYPPAWVEEYQQGNYFVGDPVFVWTVTKIGSTRWSEIKIPDVRGIMPRAAKHGLQFGATFTAKRDQKRSFLSLARPDRELTDAEMASIEAKFSVWVEVLHNKASLTPGELAVLRALRDGLSQGETATKLSVSESTVKQRIVSAKQKLGAASPTNAVAIAVTRNYL